MRYLHFEVSSSKRYGDFCEVSLKGNFEPSLPGQFYMLKGEWGSHPLLPRPISILDEEKNEIKFLIKNVGIGSKKLVELKKGEKLSGTGPLGNHFPFERIKKNEEVILIGGGVGVPPLFYLAKTLVGKGVSPIFIEGAKTKSELLLVDAIKGLGLDFEITTEDGSAGKKGVVTLIAEKFRKSANYVFACGPYGMLKSVSEIFSYGKCRCFVSLEERMACGYGICLGCAVKIEEEKGNKRFQRVCKEGPVFDSRVVVWK